MRLSTACISTRFGARATTSSACRQTVRREANASVGRAMRRFLHAPVRISWMSTHSIRNIAWICAIPLPITASSPTFLRHRSDRAGTVRATARARPTVGATRSSSSRIRCICSTATKRCSPKTTKPCATGWIISFPPVKITSATRAGRATGCRLASRNRRSP